MKRPSGTVIVDNAKKTFPVLSIKGGPAGRAVEAAVDGVPLKGVHRIELTMDVNDAIRAKTFTFVEAAVEVEATVDGPEVVLTILERVLTEPDVGGNQTLGHREVVVGRGTHLKQALRDALAQLEAADGPVQ